MSKLIGTSLEEEGKSISNPLVIEPKRMRLDVDDPFFAAGSLGRFYAFAAVELEEDEETHDAEGDACKRNRWTTRLVQTYDLLDEEEEDDEEFFSNTFACTASGCPARFRSMSTFEKHLFSRHRHRCSICQRDLTTPRLLDMHIAELHDSYFAVMAKKRPSYVCLVDECQVICSTNQERTQHLVRDHHFPKYFDFHNPGRYRKKMSKALRGKENVKKVQEDETYQNDQPSQSLLAVHENMEVETGVITSKSKHVPCNFFFGKGCHFEGDVCSFSHELIPKSQRGPKKDIKMRSATGDSEMDVEKALEELTCSMASCNLFVPRSISFGRGKGRLKFCNR